MSAKFLGLRTTIYKVADIKEATKWYSKVLGIKPYFEEAFYVGFNVGGYELGLHPEEKSTTAKGEGVITYWGVNDVEKIFNDLISEGATAHENPTNVGGDIILAAVKDPWGNLFGIIYNPEFKLNAPD